MKTRKLSIHQEHELLLKLEAAGLNEAAAQKIIESSGNRLAKEMIGLVGLSHSLTLTEAQRIMGKGNFFGPNEWLEKFGKKFRLATVPEIPWSEDELRNPGIAQEHFLFLGIDHLGNTPLDLPAWHRFFPGPGHPKFCWAWYLDPSQTFARKTCGLRWYLMPVGIVEGSNNLSYDRQVAMIFSDGYEVPGATERVTANVLFYFLNGKYLDEEYWARTNDESKGGTRVVVIGSSDGLVVNSWNNVASDHFAVAASWKFTDS